MRFLLSSASSLALLPSVSVKTYKFQIDIHLEPKTFLRITRIFDVETKTKTFCVPNSSNKIKNAINTSAWLLHLSAQKSGVQWSCAWYWLQFLISGKRVDSWIFLVNHSEKERKLYITLAKNTKKKPRRIKSFELAMKQYLNQLLRKYRTHTKSISWASLSPKKSLSNDGVEEECFV